MNREEMTFVIEYIGGERDGGETYEVTMCGVPITRVVAEYDEDRDRERADARVQFGKWLARRIGDLGGAS